MYIPESKSIQNVGWGPYRLAIKHWLKAAWHLLRRKFYELKSRVPFSNKERCFVGEIGESTLALGELYMVSILIADYDTELELHHAYTEALTMWREIHS